MKSLLFFGGPLIATIGFGFWSGLLDFAHNLEGLEHTAGVAPGGTLVIEREETYRCDEDGGNCVLVDEKTEFSEIEGLELEEQPIEYRNGAENVTVRKMPGIPKYANIVMRRPSGFDWKHLKFVFEREAALDAVRQEYDAKQAEMEAEAAAEAGVVGEVEMKQIDPPTLVIPAN